MMNLFGKSSSLFCSQIFNLSRAGWGNYLLHWVVSSGLEQSMAGCRIQMKVHTCICLAVDATCHLGTQLELCTEKSTRNCVVHYDNV